MSDAIDMIICEFLKTDFKNFMKADELALHVGKPYESSNIY